MVAKLELQIKAMLNRLNEMYDREEAILTEFKSLRLEWDQLQEDKELIQNMIMFQSNKLNRMKHLRR